MKGFKALLSFARAFVKEALTGSRVYWGWLALLALAVVPGALAYVGQWREGLAVTGMSDQVTWGAYIANFTYLVGVADAAVMLVIPAYVFHNASARRVIALASIFAGTACLMALIFVVVDMGQPLRGWHLIPMIGRLNFPTSIMAWDVIMLSGYTAISFAVAAWLLYRHYHGRPDNNPRFAGLMVLAIAWAIALHMVTAFLYSASSGRHFWASALLGPRFLASAFASGPAFILLTFRVLREFAGFKTPKEVMRLLSLIIAVALQVNLAMLLSEVFVELYAPTYHSSSARYLFFGLHGHDALVPWITTAIGMELIAVVILSVRRLRMQRVLLGIACVFCVIGVWIEKGMGLLIPGFVPTPLGEILEYTPSYTETVVSLSIWALGVLIFTLLAKPTIAIQRGSLTSPTLNLEGGETP